MRPMFLLLVLLLHCWTGWTCFAIDVMFFIRFVNNNSVIICCTCLLFGFLFRRNVHNVYSLGAIIQHLPFLSACYVTLFDDVSHEFHFDCIYPQLTYTMLLDAKQFTCGNWFRCRTVVWFISKYGNIPTSLCWIVLNECNNYNNEKNNEWKNR